jgi:molybdopterin synthase sulfur carrier subunit
MRVRMMYFAAVRDLLGRSEETIELPASVRTVGALAAWLGERDPALGARMSSVRIARNESFAETGDRLEESDEIALIPPVAGGS